jgi:site-specific recombinase XerD
MEMEAMTSDIPKNVIEQWTEDATIRGLSQATIAKYAYSLRMFDAFLQGKSPVEADRDDVLRYVGVLRGRDLSTQTIRHILAALSSFYEYFLFKELIDSNPATIVRKRLPRHKIDSEKHTHRSISVEEAVQLIGAIVDIQYKTLLLLLMKTGVRIGEALSLTVDSIRWTDQSILLKRTKKRSNLTVFFDNETEYYLRRWLAVRDMRVHNGSGLLFCTSKGNKLPVTHVYKIFSEAGMRVGLHDPNSDRLEDHICSHVGRHAFTTWLLDAGMQRREVQCLRGDAHREAIDGYDHIKLQKVRESYLAHIPQLGV